MPNFLTEEEQEFLKEDYLEGHDEEAETEEDDEEEAEGESEAEEQSETEEPDPSDEADAAKDDPKPGDVGGFEIDGIKFQAVIAADGSHQIPMQVLQQLRQQNADLKSKLAAVPAAAPAVVEDEWKDLRGMTAVERAEYALESEDNAARVEKFAVVKHNETVFESEAREAVNGFIKDHADLMEDSVYAGAIAKSFDAALARGLSPKAAIADAEQTVNKRLGIGQPEKPVPNGKQKPARVIRTLGGGPGSGSNRDTSSPDLESPDEDVVVRTYASLSEEEKRQYRMTGKAR